VKLSPTPRVKLDAETQRVYREFATQVNLLSEGKLTGSYNAMPSAPASGSYAQGDFIRNSNPTELGSGGSKYVVFGWICVTSGSPGTFLDCRFLTGN